MKTYYIEVTKPPYPSQGLGFWVFRKWNPDSLSPDLTHLFRVKACCKQDAIAKVMAGKAFTMISPEGKSLKMTTVP